MENIDKTVLFFVIVLIGLAVCFLYEHMKEKKKEERRPVPWNRILREYIGKHCEITVKDPLMSIDVVFSVTGILTDVDDEWLEMECTEKKKKRIKIIRTENVSGVNEIV